MPLTNQESALSVLGQLIRKLSVGDPRGFVGLAKRIAQANAGIRRGRVDRRKLSRVAQGEAPVFTFDELEALNRFLIQTRGEGLGAVFPSPTIVEAVAAKGHVSLLIGAKHPGARTAVSIWDFRSMEQLLRYLYRASPSIHIDISDVPLPHPRPPGGAEDGESAVLAIDDWRGLLETPDGPSLVCLGSQRACWATEVLLASMFGVAPFAPSPGAKYRAPFAFIWSAAQPDDFRSSFSVSPGDLGQGRWQVDATDWRTWGIHLAHPLDVEGGETSLLRVRHLKRRSSGDTWSSYGIIVAQRRPGGQVWLVVSGLSGPETYAGAKVVHSIVKALPSGEGLKPPPVLWALFEATVEEHLLERIGDNRALLGQKLLFQDYWQPVTPSL